MDKQRLWALGLAPLIAIHSGADAQPQVPESIVATPASAVRLRADVVAAQSRIVQRDSLRQRIIGTLGFGEGEICVTPPATNSGDIDPHRSLFVHDAATLGAGNFTLRRALQKLSSDVVADVPGTTPLSIFRQFWDSQAAAPGLDATNPHCSDNNGKIGEIPFNRCPRAERNEAVGTDAEVNTRIDSYEPISLVNRLDLADAGWRNCGEHRIVYGRSSGGVGKNFIIFEAVLPNPKPGCRSGCRDVIEFWADLSEDDSPASRATKLETFFYTGLPGFRPVVHTSHYSSGVSSVYGGSGSGQIRTNQFVAGDIWTLKEFKTLLSCAGGTCSYDIMPISVKANPYGVLWNRDVTAGGAPTAPPANAFATAIAGLPALAADFQGEVIAQVTPGRLGNPDINGISYEVQPDKNAAESQATIIGTHIDQYLGQANAAADATFRTSLAGAGGTLSPSLNATQIINRALTQSCAGCHQPISFGLTAANSIGPGLSWPAALSFVHVDVQTRAFGPAQGFDPTKFDGNATGFDISPALLGTFLPARRTVFVDEANKDFCDCVRKSGQLTDARARRFAEMSAKSNVILRRDLERAKRVNADKPEALQRASRAIVLKAERERNAQLKRLGIAFVTPSLKPERVVLSPTRLDRAAAEKEKRMAIQKIVKAEPPRKTVTGSFRTH